MPSRMMGRLEKVLLWFTTGSFGGDKAPCHVIATQFPYSGRGLPANFGDIIGHTSRGDAGGAHLASAFSSNRPSNAV